MLAACLAIACSTVQPAFALPPLTIDDFNSVAVGEDFRDDGRMRKQPCSVGTFADSGENAERVWRFFADKLPAPQIAGIIGNMQVESGVLPERLQGTPASKVTPAESLSGAQLSDGKLGWGLVQWTPPGKIINTYPDPGTANAIDNQLNFLWNQLQGGFPSPEKVAGDALKKTTTAAEAAETFARKYERPAEASLALTLSTRIKAAEAALARFQSIATVNAPVDAPADANPNATFENSCQPGDQTTLLGVAEAQLGSGGGEFYADVPNGNSADFVSWSLNKIGNPIISGGTDGGWRISSVQALLDALKNDNRFVFVPADVEKPIPGDIAFFIIPGGTQNTGIVVEVNQDGSTMSIVTTGPNSSIKKTPDLSTVLGANGLVGYIRQVGGDGNVNDLNPPPGPPVTKCDPTTQNTVTAPASTFDQTVAGAAEGTCFFLKNGQYNFHDVHPKNNMKFVGESRSGVVVDGNGFENAFSGNASNVAFNNFTLQNFNNSAGQALQEQAPIRGTLGIWQSTPGTMATGWLVENMTIKNNVASGVFVGDGFIIRNSDISDNGVTGVGGDQFSGGVVQSNFIHANGVSAAGGVDSNGGGVKFTQADGVTNRVYVTDNTITNNPIGVWCDVNCNGININNNRINIHTNSAVFIELSRNAIIANNTITNSNSQIDWNGEFNTGSIGIGESSYVLVEGNTIEFGKSAVTVRQTKRPYNGESYLASLLINGVDLNLTTHDITVNSNTITGSGSIGASNGPSGAGLIDYGTVRFTNNNYNGADQNGSIQFWWNGAQQSYATWKAAGRQ